MRPSYVLSYSLNRIQAAEFDQIWFPGNVRGKYGVILCHGLGANDQFASQTKAHSPILAASLASAGFACIAGTMAGDSFGNNTSMARMTSAHTALAGVAAGTFNGTKVHLVAISMGACLAIRWAKENPDKVASITLLIPTASIINTYNGNVGGLRASIEAAWGVAFPASLPADADLVAHAAVIKAAGIPARIYYSDTDAVIPVADINALATAMGAEKFSADPLNFGHSEATIGEIGLYSSVEGKRWKHVLDFMRKNG